MAIVIIEENFDGQYVVEDSKPVVSGALESAGGDPVILNESVGTLPTANYFLMDLPEDILGANDAVLRVDLFETLAGPIASAQNTQNGHASVRR